MPNGEIEKNLQKNVVEVDNCLKKGKESALNEIEALIKLSMVRDELVYNIKVEKFSLEFWQLFISQNDSIIELVELSKLDLLEDLAYSKKSQKALVKYKEISKRVR